MYVHTVQCVRIHSRIESAFSYRRCNARLGFEVVCDYPHELAFAKEIQVYDGTDNTCGSAYPQKCAHSAMHQHGRRKLATACIIIASTYFRSPTQDRSKIDL